jgi:hypothetical protein
MTRGSPESAQAVTIQVAEGSPAWAGHKSIVFGRYWFCGLEVVVVVAGVRCGPDCRNPLWCGYMEALPPYACSAGLCRQ